jgi:hypothetical protein
LGWNSLRGKNALAVLKEGNGNDALLWAHQWKKDVEVFRLPAKSVKSENNVVARAYFKVFNLEGLKVEDFCCPHDRTPNLAKFR